MLEEESDALLISLAQRSGGIQPLLNSVFSFLKRKTDFYHIQKPGDRIGFPPGKAKQLVLEAFNRFASHEEAIPPAKEDLETRGERLVPHEQQQKPSQASVGPPKAKIEEIADDGKSTRKGGPGGGSGKGEDSARPKSSGGTSADAAKPPEEGSGSGSSSAARGGAEGGKDASGGGFVTYNGGEGKGYRWSQTIDEVVLFVDCSAHASKVKGKDVRCAVEKKRVGVSLVVPPSSQPIRILSGELFGEVLQDDVVWHIEDGKFLSITMEKRKHTWWKSALLGDDEIDTQKVDSTCSIDDYDQPTQAAIQKLMFDQHQKMQGKPTSDELQQQDMLKKAWDAEGSPFKGTPFDPSAINFSGQMPGMPE